jgi:hypothetical protein
VDLQRTQAGCTLGAFGDGKVAHRVRSGLAVRLYLRIMTRREGAVRVPLWEWGITRETRNRPVGVSMTRHGAMAAMSRALLETGRPARGSVAPVVLVDAAHSASYYQRLPVVRTAVYEAGVIRWS